jgi:hypothetical protein
MDGYEPLSSLANQYPDLPFFAHIKNSRVFQAKAVLRAIINNWTKEQQRAASKQYTQKFLSLVENTNKQWIQECVCKPFYHRQSNTRVHVLGVLPIQFPMLSTIPFSAQKTYTASSRLAIDEIWSELADSGQESSISLTMYETKEQFNWMLNEYWSVYQDVFHSFPEDFSDMSRWAETCREQLIERNQQLDIELDVPEEWLLWMNHTGLIPKVEIIEAFRTIEEFKLNTTDGPTIADCRLVNLPYEEEFEMISTISSKLRQNIRGSNASIRDALENFYENCCDIGSEDVAAIATGHIGSDSIIQKMLIKPDDMIRYFDTLEGCMDPQGNEFTSRLLEKLATDQVIYTQIIKDIEANLNGQVKIVVADRDIYPSLKKDLYRKGWE